VYSDDNKNILISVGRARVWLNSTFLSSQNEAIDDPVYFTLLIDLTKSI
jgi:hypothetical protein